MEGLENNMATGEVKTLNGKIPGGHYNTNNVTASLVITCIVAASGGLIFGYDIGISGMFNNIFDLFIGVGVIVANCLNYGVAKLSYGWRISLGLASVPAIIMSFGGLLITDTPTSLVERGKIAQAKKALSKARGAVVNVEEELADLVKASGEAKAETEQKFVTIFERQYRPHLTMAILIAFFQQLTGISVIAFYAPVLFQSVGFGSDSALIATIILGVVNLVSIGMSSAVVDRFGRRFLFKVGGASMFVCQVNLAILIATMGGTEGSKHAHTAYAVIILVLMCLFAVGFGLSWGPLVWLIPSEIFPIRIRAMGQSISVAVNLGTTFVLSQASLTMLCHFKYGVFLFYAGWTAIMTFFVVLFLPETKGIHIAEMNRVWKQHWYWRRFGE